MNPLALGMAALSALGLLMLTSCGTDGSGNGASRPATAATPDRPSPSQTTGSSASTPTKPQPAGPTFQIAYANGKVTGDTGRLKVKVGTKVSIRVRSDVADVIHLHGYDVTSEVPAGGAGLVSFAARIPGVFSLELEKLGKELAKVQVQ